MVIETLIISRRSARIYRDQGYCIGPCRIPGKVTAIFWIPTNF